MTPRRILILSASVGAGHDGPATELSRRLRARGHHTRVVDLVEIAPFGHALRSLFHLLLARRPELWGRLVDDFEPTGQLPVVVRRLMAAAGHRVARLIDDDDIDLAVSTFPLAGRVIARARTHVARSVPLATYLTDPAVHRLWIDSSTDLYLSTWTFTHATVARLTDTASVLVAPAVRSTFAHRLEHIGLGAAPGNTRPVALVGSGSWGVGDVMGTVRDLLAGGVYDPVVACGHNDELRDALRTIPGVRALGWVQDMAALMRASAVVVLNSGGLTLAEAASLAVPVVHHRVLPGQGVLNAEACASGAGVAVTTTVAGLHLAIANARPMTPSLGTMDPVDHILALGVPSPETRSAAA